MVCIDWKDFLNGLHTLELLLKPLTTSDFYSLRLLYSLFAFCTVMFLLSYFVCNVM